MSSQQERQHSATIAACATAPGNGGIAVVRLSGPDSQDIVSRLFIPSSPAFTGFVPWKLHHGHVLDRNGEPLDDVLCVFMPGPHTFTGEDAAEIQCHGGRTVVHEILAACFACGARPAARGEFSRRALENGRMNLSQAEAVAEIIAAPNRDALRYSLNRLDGALAGRVEKLRARLEDLRVHAALAVDFPDDEVECLPPDLFRNRAEEVVSALDRLLAGFKRANLVEEGAEVVLAGSVNAGKSSLLNALLGRSRALVTDIPGTTRDFIEEGCDFDGLSVCLVDTAGLRDAGDPVEALGIARSREKVAGAGCVLLVVDGGAMGSRGAEAVFCPDPVAAEEIAAAKAPLIVVWNKADIAQPSVVPPKWCMQDGRPLPFVTASAARDENIDGIVAAVKDLLSKDLPEVADGVAPNLRQALSLQEARDELAGMIADIDAGIPYDLLSVRLDTACACLGDIVGLGTPAEVLEHVFEGFCIGK